MANSPDISALAAYAGRFEQALFSTLVNSMSAASQVQLLQNVKHKLNLTKLTVSSNARPYTGTFDGDNNDLAYSPRVLEVEQWQRDILVEPAKYRTTWMAEQMAAGSTPNNTTIPFAQYTMDQIFRQLAADINDEVIYHGLDKDDFSAFDAGATYTAGDLITYTRTTDDHVRYWKALASTSAGEDPEDTPAKWEDVTIKAIAEGFGSHIADAISGSSLSATTVGAIDNSSIYAVAAFLEVYQALPEAYRNIPVKIFCSRTDFDFLLEDIHDRYGKYSSPDVAFTTAAGVPAVTLPRTGGLATVESCSWMSGSRRIIATPMNNLVIGTDLLSDFNQIRTIEDVYTLKMGVSGVIGTQIRDFSAMAINDQA